MRLRLFQIPIKLDYTPQDVTAAVARRLGVPEPELCDLEILRRSLDARGDDRPPRYVLSVDVTYQGAVPAKLVPGSVVIAPEPEPSPSARPSAPRRARPIVVGAGPAGLMAALTLAEADHRPLLIERGADTETRQLQVERFWTQGALDPQSNVLYGEGGAGLFSDGKLTSRSKDHRAIRTFFEVLVSCGAPRDVLIDAEPHLGSDRLADIMPQLRQRIVQAGGDVRLHVRLEDLHVVDGALRGVVASGTEYESDACFLATGHSARDVYQLLERRAARLEAKPFAIGVRLELPQRRIDRAQYGRHAADPRLGSASFRLTRKGRGEVRNCYTFCMCPGGVVMACASEPGMLTTNGMSYAARAKPFANAAFLVPVMPEDFPPKEGPSRLAPLRFQEALEQAGFRAGGGDYALPAQRLVDFLHGARTKSLPAERSCRRAVAGDIAELLPSFVVATLRAAIPAMLRELNGVRLEEALLYAPETRSSSPVRIVRDASTGDAVGIRGLYPIGEGSGYAGGIVSSALDGIHAAARYTQTP